jgi:hypothetical protein
MSQGPAEARHSAPTGAKPSGGQLSDPPSHASALSHGSPEEFRQTEPADTGVHVSVPSSQPALQSPPHGASRLVHPPEAHDSTPVQNRPSSHGVPSASATMRHPPVPGSQRLRAQTESPLGSQVGSEPGCTWHDPS